MTTPDDSGKKWSLLEIPGGPMGSQMTACLPASPKAKNISAGCAGQKAYEWRSRRSLPVICDRQQEIPILKIVSSCPSSASIVGSANFLTCRLVSWITLWPIISSLRLTLRPLRPSMQLGG